MMKLMRFGEVSPAEIFARAVPEIDVSAVVADILRAVRARGDAALLEYNETFEKAKLDALEVSPEEFDAALAATDPAFLGILERAAANIRAFHSKQLRAGFRMDLGDRILGQRSCPSKRWAYASPAGKRRFPPPF